LERQVELQRSLRRNPRTLLPQRFVDHIFPHTRRYRRRLDAASRHGWDRHSLVRLVAAGRLSPRDPERVRWNLFAVSMEGSRWGKVERLTTEAGPDLKHRLKRDSSGRLWLVWQASAMDTAASC